MESFEDLLEIVELDQPSLVPKSLLVARMLEVNLASLDGFFNLRPLALPKIHC